MTTIYSDWTNKYRKIQYDDYYTLDRCDKNNVTKISFNLSDGPDRCYSDCIKNEVCANANCNCGIVDPWSFIGHSKYLGACPNVKHMDSQYYEFFMVFFDYRYCFINDKPVYMEYYSKDHHVLNYYIYFEPKQPDQKNFDVPQECKCLKK